MHTGVQMCKDVTCWNNGSLRSDRNFLNNLILSCVSSKTTWLAVWQRCMLYLASRSSRKQVCRPTAPTLHARTHARTHTYTVQGAHQTVTLSRHVGENQMHIGLDRSSGKIRVQLTNSTQNREVPNLTCCPWTLSSSYVQFGSESVD
jgi:hypothetical protein